MHFNIPYSVSQLSLTTHADFHFLFLSFSLDSFESLFLLVYWGSSKVWSHLQFWFRTFKFCISNIFSVLLFWKCHKENCFKFFWDLIYIVLSMTDRQINSIFVCIWLILYWLFDKFLCFNESGIIASSPSSLKVENYYFEIYLDNNLYKQQDLM